MTTVKETINQRQLAWMTVIILVGGGLLGLQRDLIRIAEKDAWLTYIVPLFYAFIVAYIFYVLSQQYPRKNIFEITFLLAGKWVGGMLNLLILLQLFSIIIRDLRVLGIILDVILLPDTPLELILFLFLLLIIYYGSLELEVAARVTDLIYPLFILSILALPFLLLNEIEFHYIQPVLTMNTPQFVFDSLLNIGWFGDMIILGAFLHAVTQNEKMFHSIKYGVIASVFLLTFIMLLILLVLGHTISGRSLFPDYTLVEQINITDFLDRVELFIFSIWIPAYMLKIIYAFLAFCIGIRSFLGSSYTASVLKPIALFILLFAILSFASINDVFAYSSYGSLLMTLLIQLPLLILLYIINAVKHLKKKASALTKKPVSTLTVMTYFLLLTSLAFVLFGIFFALDYALIGYSMGIGYFSCILLAMLLSRQEL